ncbi:hypothetical protein TPR58_16625 [Sphingomonas sp. HF-S3]|jgi:hypothetical protein|uniref:Uncharacterized protein n=1 Tax=Sphingomonas rustica TaxID=3103142 RepID=A0ABV0BD48_9SPHN
MDVLPPFLADAAQVADAAELILMFGDEAGCEAASRADRSRGMGNTLHYLRWRQIERLVALLSCDEAIGTVH